MLPKPILFILLATLSFAVMNMLAKYLSDFHPMQVIFFRTLGTVVFVLPYMIWHRIPILGTHHRMLLLRSVVGLISLATFFMAIQRMPLGSAVSIRYLGPIFGAILAFLFLKEKITWLQWLSFAVAFSGVIVLKGFDLRIDQTGLILVLTSAVTVGVVFVLIRYLATREHYLTIINYFMCISLFFSIGFFSYFRMPVGMEWGAILSIGIFGLIGQVLMTRAFELELTSVLAPFKYMELVYALILGFLIFGETYSLLPFLGILLIVSGMVMNLLEKNLN